MPALLQASNLRVEFRTSEGTNVALNHIDLSINEGQVLGIVGESGSGKSVVAKTLVNLVPPPGRIVSGSVLYEGRDLLRESERALRRIRGRQIGLIVQNAKSSLNPLLTVGDQLANVIRAHGERDKKVAAERAVLMLKKVGIQDPATRMHSYPHQLSGGMAQRVIIAMAISNNPRLLIADEPTSGLDVTIQAQILNLIQGLVKELNSATILITRDLGIVAQHCENVAVLCEGQIVEQAPVEKFFKNPEHPYSGTLVNAVSMTRDHGRRLAPGRSASIHRSHGGDPSGFPPAEPSREAAGAAVLVSATIRALPRTQKQDLPAPLVQVEHLVKHFAIAGSSKPLQAVSDVSFAIHRGQTMGIVGESGSGKTTIGRCVLRLIDPTSGRVLIDGFDLSTLSKEGLRSIRPKMQLVFQEPFDSLDPQKSVGEIIAEPLRLHNKLSSASRRERVLELLGNVGLAKQLVDRYPHQLAAGQQQRVGIARAIATEPSFIVLDEPVSSLDPTAQAEILDLLINLQDRLGIAYLFISHDLMTVRFLCHWVAVMYLGKIVEMGPTQQLFEHPIHPYTRALLSAVPVPDPEVRQSKFILKGEIPSPISLPTGCHLHSRCPAALDVCATNVPDLEQIRDRHWVSCLRAREPDFEARIQGQFAPEPIAPATVERVTGNQQRR